MAVELNDVESKLRAEITVLLNSMHEYYRGTYVGERNIEEVLAEMGAKAHELHVSLANKGTPPKHHAYMIRNREVSPEDREFYVHVHPVEDLLKFLNDENANDDPVDQTIGHEFTFRVCSNRWEHPDTIRIIRTADGWDVRFRAIGGPSDKTGDPFLFRNLDHDQIQYPKDLGGWFEWLWKQAASQGLSHDSVQEAIQELADWVSNTERNTPKGDVWTGY